MTAVSSTERLEAFLKVRLTNQTLISEPTLYPALLKHLSPRPRPGDGSAPPPLHWFCDKAASPLHTELATYLISTFAYTTSDDTQKYLRYLRDVVTTCHRCARSFCGARAVLLRKYISTYSANNRRSFSRAIDKWQADIVYDALEGLAKETGTSTTDRSFLALPSPHLQLLFGMPDPGVLQDPRLLKHITDKIASLPSTSPAVSDRLVRLGSLPGLLLLGWKALDVTAPATATNLRAWAEAQIRGSAFLPLSSKEWDYLNFAEVWESLLVETDVAVGDEAKAKVHKEDEFYRWVVIQQVLESGCLSKECFETKVLVKGGANVQGVLASKLTASDAIFPILLKVQAAILRISPSAIVWTSADPSPEFPFAVWANIHHNQTFNQMLRYTLDESTYDGQDPGLTGVLHGIKLANARTQLTGNGRPDPAYGPYWVLLWLSDFLASVHDLSMQRKDVDMETYEDLLARVANFCFEASQHPRYSENYRARAFENGARIMQDCVGGWGREHAERSAVAAGMKVMEINASTLLHVVVDQREHPEVIWGRARKAVLKVLYHVMMADGQSARTILKQVGLLALDGRRRKGPDTKDRFPTLRIHSQIWARTYAAAPITVDVLGLLMRGQVRFAHMAMPVGHAWSYDQLEFWRSEGHFERSISSLIHAMKRMRSGFGDVVGPFTAVSDHNTLIRLWSTPRIPESIIRLLLCPDESVHDAVIGLVAQVFSTDGRAECIRALLCRYPAETISGLIDHLRRWHEDVDSLPTMVESARWLVRCFTDIIEALCTGSIDDVPFLKDPSFLKATFPTREFDNMSQAVSILWQSMCRVIDSIYKRSRPWSAWHENEEMVDWMRDALIFGRLIVEEVRTFEAAVSGGPVESQVASVAESPRVVTDLGIRMIADLEPVFSSLLTWLRVTEVETLHQSLELIKQLLDTFRRHQVEGRVSPKLQTELYNLGRICHRATSSTKLTDTQLSELLDLITPIYRLPDDVSQLKPKAPLRAGAKDRSSPTSDVAQPKKRDAFAELMKSSHKSTSSSSAAQRISKTTRPASGAPIEILDSDDDDDAFADLANPFAGLSAADLARLEKGKSGSRQTLPTMSAQAKPTSSTLERRLAERARLRLDVTRPPVRASKTVSKPKGLLGQLKQQTREQRAVITPLPRSRVGAAVAPAVGPSRPAPRMAPTPAPQQVVSESSDSSSADEGASGGLRRLIALEVDPKAVAAHPRIRPAEIPGPSKPLIVKETALHIQQRLRPDMSYLFKTMLSWDPKYRGSQNLKLGRIPPQFQGTKQYHEVMVVLFLQGLWDEVVAKFEEPDSANVAVQILGRYFEDSNLVIELSPVTALIPGWNVNENDLCLLISTDGTEMHFVKIDSMKRQGKNATIKLRMSSDKDGAGLQSQKRWILRKHANLVTAIREYAALKSLVALELCMLECIIKGRPTKLPESNENEVARAMAEYNVNYPQAQAILGAMRIEGFALIQGPPGTGKTKTISGLVGKFMSERKHHIRTDRPGETTSAKLLVCAPSNAAIDEVTRRLKDGVPLGGGHIFKPKIVRIGAESSMNAAVVDVGLDALVEARMSAFKAAKGGDKGGSEISKAESALDQIRRDRESMQAELTQIGNSNDDRRKQIEDSLQKLVSERIAKSKELNRARDAARDYGRQIDAARREAREKIMEEADIVCSTLAGAGHDSLKPFEFGTVIIDEAAQAIELATLIPLKYRCRRCILVGDPKQLPPTVISQAVESLGYNESLFVRLCKDRPDAMHLLSIQYRMHPDISRLPSHVFYEGKLTDGPDMATTTIAPWHQSESFGTYRFFNVDGVESRRGHSVVNVQEVDAIVSLYRGLKAMYGASDRLFGQIGIVTMYKEQSNELKSRFRRNFGESAFEDIDFNTVDGFQGQEKAIIILSTVRSGPNLDSIGFLKDRRRMNVALTRAKSSLFIFGNAATLERSNVDWRYIVGDARQRGFFAQYQNGLFDKPLPAIARAPVVKSIAYVNPAAAPQPAGPLGASSASNRKNVKPPRPQDGPVPVQVPSKRPASRQSPPENGSSATTSQRKHKIARRMTGEEAKPSRLQRHDTSGIRDKPLVSKSGKVAVKRRRADSSEPESGEVTPPNVVADSSDESDSSSSDMDIDQEGSARTAVEQARGSGDRARALDIKQGRSA